MTSPEHVLLRDDHSRSTESPVVSTATSCSTSITPGPGALSAKFLKWVGNTSLDSLQDLAIRRRLGVIKQVVRKRPSIFTYARSSQEMHEVERIYLDLQELCSGPYASMIRRRAARMVLEIAFLTHSRLDTSYATFDWATAVRDPWNRWTTLLKLTCISVTHQLSFPPTDNPLIDSMDNGVSSMGTYRTDYGAKTNRTIRLPFIDHTWSPIKWKSLDNWSVDRKITHIKRTARQRPHIFTGPHLQQVQEVDDIYSELTFMIRHPSLRIRQRAARLVLEITAIIAGPSEIFSTQTPVNSDAVTTTSPPMWDELVTRNDVQSLLMLPLASPLTLTRLTRDRD